MLLPSVRLKLNRNLIRDRSRLKVCVSVTLML